MAVRCIKCTVQQYTSSYPLSNKPFTRSRCQEIAQSDYDRACLMPSCIQLNGAMQLNPTLTMQFTDHCFMVIMSPYVRLDIWFATRKQENVLIHKCPLQLFVWSLKIKK